VIVTSDHGEELGDHDPGRVWDAHCSTQYHELLRVPLVVKLPGLEPRVVRQSVRLVDVLPTLLDWLALPPTAGLSGRSVLPLMRGQALPPAWSLAEATCAPPEIKALRGERLKYVARFAPEPAASAPEREWLFDLAQDPAELHDLSGTEPETLARLRDTLHGLLADPRRRPPAVASSALDHETRERLRALGYVD
jgi:arylsulfatase A-like enzyme